MSGQAIDFNARIESSGKWCNSKCLLSEGKKADSVIGKWIKAVESGGLRWGGRWRTPDSVHFDNGLNVHSPAKWDEAYKQMAQAHRNGCW